jgi:thiol-disulfide isomerase/thioredoxin
MQPTPKSYDATIARRERNLDHWDVPTAAAYLGLHPETLKPLPQSGATSASSADGAVDEYIGHDAAILFYAQWCHNCHAVAPSWDAIATHLNAGSKSSKLVMALFDCEKNTKHMELCVAVGVKAYPTMMYVGSGEYYDTDPLTSTLVGKDKSAGPFGATTLKRTVKFQGNWQYADQILDWVTMMRGLSSWHLMNQRGPLKNFRNGIFGLFHKNSDKGKAGGMSLPVGVPPGFQPEIRSGSVGSSPELEKKAKDLELKLNSTSKKAELYEKAVSHSNNLLEGLLFPSDATRDVFTILTARDGWFQNATTLPSGARNDEHPSILRSCAAELSLDYCTRITSKETTKYVEELAKIPEEDPFPTMEEIEQHLVDRIHATEPYCSLVEACIVTDYESPKCRPEKCPFENKAACDYIQNCFGVEIQNEYGSALGILAEGESVATVDWSKGKGAVGRSGTDGGSEKVGVGGWGVPTK